TLDDITVPTDAETGVPAGPPEPPAFYAPGQRELQEPRNADIHTALTYSSLNGYRDLQLNVYAPTDRTAPVPCVIWIHGGAWLFGSREFLPF
ncbi:hypothetical protein ACC691_38765, partial [Rhizobium johnstonii]